MDDKQQDLERLFDVAVKNGYNLEECNAEV